MTITLQRGLQRGISLIRHQAIRRTLSHFSLAAAKKALKQVDFIINVVCDV